MKKLLCVIICILTAFCFVGCKEEQAEEMPPMELMAKTISQEHDFAIVDSKGTKWLDNDDVTGVFIMLRKEENRYLEFRFTEDGAKQFKKAVRKNKNGELSITLDGEVLASGVIANQETPEYAKLTGKYETIIGLFNQIT